MSAHSQLPPDVHAYYELGKEAGRLAASAPGRLEFLRTQELLRRWLPLPPADVLDVGGGAGVHARWLSADGYHVTLIDPVPTHVDEAAALGGFGAEVGDARALAAPDGSVDAVLLLGPLYHLVEREDRLLALAQAHRVLRSGGVIAAAAVGRYGAMLELAAQGRLDASTEPRLEQVHRTGRHDPSLGFTTAYFHRPDELAAEVQEAGFSGVSVVGVEGPTWTALQVRGVEGFEEQFLSAAMVCALMSEGEPALSWASSHLLAVGRKG